MKTTYIPASELDRTMIYVGSDNKEYAIEEVKIVEPRPGYKRVMVMFDASDVEATGGSFRSWKLDHEVRVKAED